MKTTKQPIHNVKTQINSAIYYSTDKDGTIDLQILKNHLKEMLDEQKHQIGLQFKDWFFSTKTDIYEVIEDAIERITGVKCKKYEEN